MNEVNENRLMKMEKIFSYHERECVMLVIDSRSTDDLMPKENEDK